MYIFWYNRLGDKMKNIKAIVCDLDGTLLSDTKQVSEANKKAIRLCRERGMLFGIASGRPVEPILNLIKDWGIIEEVDFVLGMNGGVIYDCHTHEKDEYHLVDGEILKDVMRHFDGMDVRFIIYEGNTRHVNVSTADTIKQAALFKEDEKLSDLFSMCDRPRNKIIVQCDASYMPLVEEHGKRYQNDGCVCFKTAPVLFEYVNPKINKSFGLQKMCEKHQIAMDNVLAFGDTSNDLEMIRDAGIGVWMCNGTEDVKAVCNAITCSNNEDGVAAYIHEHILDIC